MNREIIIKAIDEEITNCTDEFKEVLVNCVLKEYDGKSNHKNSIISFIRSKFHFPAMGRSNEQYWLARGHDKLSARANIHEYKKTRPKRAGHSPYSREFWTQKINPLTKTYYTDDEADFERNSRRPIRKEYWMKKGYNIDESVQLALDAKNKNNKKGNEGSTKSEFTKINNQRSMDYWLIRGYDEETAKNKLSQIQTTFSLEICIEKHCEEKGLEIWKKRQEKWMKSIVDNNDMDTFNASKSILHSFIGLSKDEIIEKLTKLNFTSNMCPCTNLSEFKDLIQSILNDKPYYIYFDAKYIFNTLQLNNYYYLQMPEDEIIDFIDKNFKFKTNQQFFFTESKYNSYNLYTKEGYYLRSSNEISFYELCNKHNISFDYEKNYPNSSLKYDFYLKDYDIIVEIAGMMGHGGYDADMVYKQNTFGSIILEPDRIKSFIEEIIDGSFDRSNYRIS